MIDYILILLVAGVWVISYWKEKIWVSNMLSELEEAKALVGHVQELLADY